VKGRKVVKGRGKKCPNCGTGMEYVSDSFSYCPHCKIRRKNKPEFIQKIKFEKKERKKLEKQVKIWTSKNTSQEALRKLAGVKDEVKLDIPMESHFQESTGDG
jgi:DNA-directed RNA polymerase subunit M/transcription elongation factor TFIIS